MSPENFVYWLQGYLELSDSKDLDSNQLDIVKDHLKLVFNKVTPAYREKFYDPMAYNNSYYDSCPQVSC